MFYNCLLCNKCEELRIMLVMSAASIAKGNDIAIS